MVLDLYCSRQFPSELDNFIFNDLKAIYSPDFEKAYLNKNADIEHQKKNLGTYFPRSFVEAYLIFKDLHNNEYIKSIFEKNEFFILDIGGGVGGNLFGLLWFMKEHIKDFKSKRINVISLDCNDFALDIQEKIIRMFFLENTYFYSKSPNLSRNNFNEMINSVSEDYRCINHGYKNKFDIIMSFKFVNEFYRKYQDYCENKGMYKQITDTITNLLDENGLFLLADTSDKNDFDYFPKIMNKEIFEYLKNNDEKLKPIVPLSCAIWHNDCIEPFNCYNLRIFNIITSKERFNSKLSYKIFAHKVTANKILNLIERQDNYHMGYGHVCKKGKFEFGSSLANESKNAFSYYDNLNKK
ncbi:MAG: hypothetical protein Q8M95_09830 [Candidatus Methanoperedens sp.]|nr:hypothetical protein [Candidatus Methanoperedens sp.]